MEEIVVADELCRACLTRSNDMKDLTANDEYSLTLIKMLSCLCHSKQIEINEGLPNFLCLTCENKLKISYEFQQICLKSQKIMLDCAAATQNILYGNASQKAHTSEENLNLIFVSSKQTEIKNQSPTPDTDHYHLNNGCGTECVECIQKIEVEKVALVNSEHFRSHLENVYENGSFPKPLDIQRNTTNQTMRLTQYSADDINKLVNKIRGRYSNGNKCLFCGFFSKDLRALSVHMTKLHIKEKQDWCSFCNKTFEDIYRHLQESHQNELTCPLCGKQKSNTGHFIEHLTCHSIDRNYECNICNKAFISSRHLKSHSKRHFETKSYSCKLCQKVFSFEKSLKKHLKQHSQEFSIENSNKLHSPVENVEVAPQSSDVEKELKVQNVCTVCNKRVRSLEKHDEMCHSVPDKSSQELCSYCGKQFSSKSKLTVHNRIHTGECRYECSYCNLKMSTRSHLVAHERTHTGQKPYVCKFCNKRFNQSSILGVHMKIHTGRPEQCMLCLKRFCRPSELKQHMRTHTGEKPYLCTQCESGFKQKSHLVEHIRTHSNDKPYQCEYCERNFKYPSSLTSHIKVHLVETIQKCPHCVHEFHEIDALNEHLRKHESKSLEVKESETTLDVLNMYRITPTSLDVFTE